MILSKLTLHDFGVYGGLQEIDLTPPSAQKPIVLFDGLNGTGKTTFLDAIQLCLFGPVAKCSNRGTTPYNTFLAKCINRQSQWGQASLGLDFTHVVNGKKQEYTTRRTWKKANGRVSETFDIYQNDKPLSSSSESWLQHIEEIIPANIANLFFFDGEEAEQYALHDSSQEILKTGVHNLLGLDVVDRLIEDLQTLEKKTVSKQGSIKVAKKMDGLDMHIASLKEEQKTYLNEKSLLEERLELFRKQLSSAEKRFKEAGGDLYERRNELDEIVNRCEHIFQEARQQLQNLAEGSLPLKLTHKLLDKILLRDKEEQKILASKYSANILEELSTDCLSVLSRKGTDQKTIELVRKELGKSLSGLMKQAKQKPENPIDDHTRTSIKYQLSNVSPPSDEIVVKQIEDYDKASIALDAAENESNSVVEPEAIRSILEERNSLRTELKSIEERIEEIDKKFEQVERDLARNNKLVEDVISSMVENKIEKNVRMRLITHSNKTRDVLKLFRSQIVTKHKETIEYLVLESFQSLLRKQALIEKISICPETFSITLFGANNKKLPADRLSAGERQLFAISLLWGLAKASGRPLPVAIDTPLGRLDASHRKLLVDRYFPNASHQVMLFSTDQEIQGEYLKALKPSIGRHYQLSHCEKTGDTKVVSQQLS